MNKLPVSRIEEIITNAVEIEKEFVVDALQADAAAARENAQAADKGKQTHNA